MTALCVLFLSSLIICEDSFKHLSEPIILQDNDELNYRLLLQQSLRALRQQKANNEFANLNERKNTILDRYSLENDKPLFSVHNSSLLLMDSTLLPSRLQEMILIDESSSVHIERCCIAAFSTMHSSFKMKKGKLHLSNISISFSGATNLNHVTDGILKGGELLLEQSNIINCVANGIGSILCNRNIENVVIEKCNFLNVTQSSNFALETIAAQPFCVNIENSQMRNSQNFYEGAFVDGTMAKSLIIFNCSITNGLRTKNTNKQRIVVKPDYSFSFSDFMDCVGERVSGGAIYLMGEGQLNISNCTFQNCSNTGINNPGGTIATQTGKNVLRIDYSNISLGRSEFSGGGVYVCGKLSLKYSHFNNCSCGGGNGGALAMPNVTSFSEVYDVKFENNDALSFSNGGAVYFGHLSSGVNITSCTFAHNSAYQHGGALYFYGDASMFSVYEHVYFSSVEFSYNTLISGNQGNDVYFNDDYYSIITYSSFFSTTSKSSAYRVYSEKSGNCDSYITYTSTNSDVAATLPGWVIAVIVISIISVIAIPLIFVILCCCGCICATRRSSTAGTSSYMPVATPQSSVVVVQGYGTQQQPPPPNMQMNKSYTPQGPGYQQPMQGYQADPLVSSNGSLSNSQNVAFSQPQMPQQLPQQQTQYVPAGANAYSQQGYATTQSYEQQPYVQQGQGMGYSTAPAIGMPSQDSMHYSAGSTYQQMPYGAPAGYNQMPPQQQGYMQQPDDARAMNASDKVE
ncbi:uncharacterized protein MONOS_9589 [Monocercomonoides exilis]|uniref:uncharacterized protein n=1 Tax=Monocercomonoides exilis TaxID=2049356 RepID=UPI00355A1927|nr:hypothetical protein MONOS_9589 [Monocercomonoides exilis]|eukprot:MONOS_9589.1-p1 / transcript=MONOS_9589.1 / gene=MONOS_9589 / organism=Monocercomonoides_exilis_PA203 / gene_product=unspecified product / transcript_product=unspecified product / location=Mono_scaffold00401:31732-33960(-) / protein_length=743 / sequence_SO=supercontig / SO=protein_coding / is_pseudo=false